MGKEMRTFREDLLRRALEDMRHSGGTPYGQSCHFDADTWHELMAFLRASLDGEPFYLEPEK